MIIDIFTHVIPRKYKDLMYKIAPKRFYIQDVIESLPTLFDLEHRFRIMDKHPDIRQVLTMSLPPVEQYSTPQQATDMAKLANDEIAELLVKYPDRFVAGVAALPLNNIEATLEETDRAINDLKLKGIQIFTSVNDKAMDSPEFWPLYEKMEKNDLPIWIHPTRTSDLPDYRLEKRSKYMIFHVFGWPYDTSATMARLVFSGVLEKYPNLKFITHHCGGMVPYFAERIVGAYDHARIMRDARYISELSQPPIYFFKKFYADTAIYGNTPGLMCGLAFFGIDHMLFGTDFPYDSEYGARYNRQTVKAVQHMNIGDRDKQKIFEDNAKELLSLPI